MILAELVPPDKVITITGVLARARQYNHFSGSPKAQ